MNNKLKLLQVAGIVMMFGAIGGALISVRAATMPRPVVQTESGKCLTGGIPVRMADCSESTAQTWERTQDQPLVNAGRCLDIDRARGSSVQMADCDGSKYQRWHVNESGALVNLASADCLQPKLGGQDGVLDMAACSGALAQRWTVQD